ncbi:hypothetical protein IM043_gp082 [Bacillus phage SPG24]|uniref:hypothetical protein n=1 Tax=Bacillus phage SPG24 TaxID=1497851 RepID=UPI000EB6C85E|nr:hypothetical protein IM043_gp082 [Bacillus phage SPG24]ATN94415.1 hypothetical protein BSP9_066 [Bacillus phage BSP9]
MKRDKYIVWEVEDLPELTKQELGILNSISERMAMEKQVKGKDTNPNYLVIKTSASYAGTVRDLMRQHGDWD